MTPADAPPLAPPLPDIGPVMDVSEADYIIVSALANVRAAIHLAGELLPCVEGVYTDDEARAILRALHRIQAKITFKMGTTDERDLALALKEP